MTIVSRLFVALLLLAGLSACQPGKHDEKTGAAATPTVPALAQNPAPAAGRQPLRAAPDFGGVRSVSREAEGIGSTPELATLAALQSAVAQVNGVQVASRMQSMRGSLRVDDSTGGAASLDADGMLQEASAASGGAVLGYRVLSQEEVTRLDADTMTRVRASDAGFDYSASGSAHLEANASVKDADGSAEASAAMDEEGRVKASQGARSLEYDQSQRSMRSYWKIKIRADIAQYRAPDEQGRPKIVVAMPRTSSATYAVGDGRVDSNEVANAIRARLSDTLTQTKRFIVLDRELDDEMQAEIDHIGSGNVRAIDTARLGQQLAADLILVPTIERFEYPRSVRGLHMSSRKVVSYSGGGRIGLRLVNATTGEVVMSESFDHTLAGTGPSTLPRVVDGKGMAATMMDGLSGDMAAAIVAGIFPVSVIALQGNTVVLSQGGDTVHVGERYQAVALGEPLTDPQTGRSLGRMETPCCVVRIERVAQQTAYGVIVDSAGMPAGKAFVPGSIELRQRLAGAAAGNSETSTAAKSAAAVATRGSRKPPAKNPAAAVPAAKTDEDPNW